MTVTSAGRSSDEQLPCAVLESLPDSIVVTTCSGEITYLNLAAKRLLGTTLNRARGQPLAKILTILDGTTRMPVPAPLSRFIARTDSRKPAELDFLVRPDGKEVPIEVNCTPLRGTHSGESCGIVLVLRDGTQCWELASRATHDPLTRLVNRQEFEERLQRALAGTRLGESHALLYMDLDRFKEINDTYGHAAGDSVLRQVATIFESKVRSRDTLARIGGDEFALLLQHCPFEYAQQHANTLRQQLRTRPLRWKQRTFYLDVAIGIVTVTSGDRNWQAVLAAADRACYVTKHEHHRDQANTPVASRNHALTRNYH